MLGRELSNAVKSFSFETAYILRPMEAYHNHPEFRRFVPLGNPWVTTYGIFG